MNILVALNISLIALTGSFLFEVLLFLKRKSNPLLNVFAFFEGVAWFSIAIFVCKNSTLYAFVFAIAFLLSDTVFRQIFIFFEEGKFQKFFNLEWYVLKLAIIALTTWIIPFGARYLLYQRMTVKDWNITITLMILILLYEGLKVYRRYPKEFKDTGLYFLTALRPKIARK